MPLDYSTAVPVKCIAEEYSFIAAHPCPCGGRWRVLLQALLKGGQDQHYDQLDVTCRQCGARRTFLFDISSLFSQRGE